MRMILNEWQGKQNFTVIHLETIRICRQMAESEEFIYFIQQIEMNLSRFSNGKLSFYQTFVCICNKYDIAQFKSKLEDNWWHHLLFRNSFVGQNRDRNLHLWINKWWTCSSFHYYSLCQWNFQVCMAYSLSSEAQSTNLESERNHQYQGSSLMRREKKPNIGCSIWNRLFTGNPQSISESFTIVELVHRLTVSENCWWYWIVFPLQKRVVMTCDDDNYLILSFYFISEVSSGMKKSLFFKHRFDFTYSCSHVSTWSCEYNFLIHERITIRVDEDFTGNDIENRTEWLWNMCLWVACVSLSPNFS